jgi:hypothetical protein
MSHNELAMEAVSVANAAIEHPPRIRAWCEKYQNALLRPPRLFDSMTVEILAELLIDNVSCKEKSDFSQLRQLMLGECL